MCTATRWLSKVGYEVTDSHDCSGVVMIHKAVLLNLKDADMGNGFVTNNLVSKLMLHGRVI